MQDMFITADMCGSDYDSRISIFAGIEDNIVAFNEDNEGICGGGLAAALEDILLLEGVAYLIVVVSRCLVTRY